MKKVIVTGGAGFIGSHLVEALVAKKYDVVVIDNLVSGFRENLTPVLDAIRFVEGDICDEGLLQQEFSGATCVYHQAAIPSVPRSLEDPHGTNKANIEGTKCVFSAACESNVPKVVYASSSSVYGDSPTLPKHEEMPMMPISRYALQKATDEHYGKEFHRKHGLETVGLRYFNVFGPKQNPNSQYAAAIPLFIKQIARGEQPVIFGDGETTRDFTYVANVASANLLAGEKDGVAGEVFNIATGTQISLNELIQTIARILDMDVKPIYKDFRPGDVRHSRADIEKAENMLGYKTIMQFEDGLKKTVEYILEKEEKR